MAADEPARCQLDALATFAFYAGVGMKTAMGMGQCRRMNNEQMTNEQIANSKSQTGS
jgi:CRISPR/Cas system endoribonuclease Cas6 (RAMP superfamily)